MYQAIRTKYIGPRNVRGSRVKAIAEAGSVTLEWDDGLNDIENHKAACRAILVKFGWRGQYMGGAFGSGEYVWVHAGESRYSVMI